jgi:hypothetical protein
LLIILECDAHFLTNILILHKTNGLSTNCFLHLYCTHLIMNILLFIFRNALSSNKHFHDTIINSINIKASKFFVYTNLFIITHIYSKFFSWWVFEFFWMMLWDFILSILSQVECHWWVVHFIGTHCGVRCSHWCGVLQIHHLFLNLSSHLLGMVGSFPFHLTCGNITNWHQLIHLFVVSKFWSFICIIFNVRSVP